MSGRDNGNWRRPFNRWAPLGLAGVGMVVVGLSITVQNLALWFTLILVGLFLILGAFWYKDNPFLTSERRYYALRSEVAHFVGLVRKLNSAARQADRGALEQVKEQMHRSVERMVEVADREESDAD